jgi:multiple sugar transport system substrate-binding protein
MPWKANPVMLMYNVDALAAAKVLPPRNHSELLEAFRRLARDDDHDGRFDHWAMWAPLKTTWFERFYDFYPLYLAGSGGVTLLSHGETSFDNAAAVAAIEVLRKGFADNLHYDVTPIPVPDDVPPEAAYTFADVKSIAVFSTTRYPEEAARFVAFLASPEADRRLIETTAQLPYRRGLAADDRFRGAMARWPTLPKYADRIERMRDVDPDPDVVEIFDILSEGYEAAAIYGTVSPRAALKDATREVNTVLHAR